MNTPSVFLIDDDEDDKELFLEAIGEVNPSVKCRTADSGEEALAVLKDEGTLIPDFIFLDINMPGIGGMECLAELRKMRKLSHVPVIIYTTSGLKKDMDETEKLGASGYFTKPGPFEEICTVIRHVLKGNGLKNFRSIPKNN
jgi:CheY-like chemotaxis protein